LLCGRCRAFVVRRSSFVFGNNDNDDDDDDDDDDDILWSQFVNELFRQLSKHITVCEGETIIQILKN